MKKGLVMIIILSLALMASACGTSNLPGYIDYGAEESNAAGGALNSNMGSIPPLSLKTTILTTPTGEELLNALLEVEAVSNSTKDIIANILVLLPVLEDWLAEIPDETWQAIDEIMGNVTELETVPDTIDFLQDAVDSGNYSGHEYLPEALGFGIELLEDGKYDLYDPDWSVYAGEPFYSYGFNVSQMTKAALEGGIAGAVGAALADFAPAQYVINIGGCLGSVNSLVADVISQLSDWW